MKVRAKKTTKAAAPETRGEKRLRVATARVLKAARAAAKALGPDAPAGPLSQLRFAVADLNNAARDLASEKRAATRARKAAER